jgi:FtsH-binding integral membrane protein
MTILSIIQTINQLLAAGISITAFSLLLYALSFNLKDRVARSFALIMACVVVVFVGAFALKTVNSTNSPSGLGRQPVIDKEI